jgi:hypothetical protein
MDDVLRTHHLTSLDWLGLGEAAASALPRAVATQAEYFALAGLDGPDPYARTLERVERVIQALQRAKEDLEALAAHVHA